MTNVCTDEGYDLRVHVNSVQNQASPANHGSLKLLRSDWFENLSENFLTKNFVKDVIFADKIS